MVAQPRKTTLFPYTTLFRSVILAGVPWRAAVLAGAAAIVLAGLATAWRGPRWPAMGVRFERPGRTAPARRPEADSATMWESLDRKSTRLNFSHSSISYAGLC